ncbi:hypothetical protein [uncultured Clostridium sp.]|jgi:hypothetical protein|uniref:hypothetical protein n=1 Tax=uncultured Clostridium sp. TaxID=59620 RepID=UPI0025DC0494|nr:hypothetical protein [uncultured Clostridium sp.]
MKKNINKKVYILVGMSILTINIIIVIILQIQNRKLEIINNEIQLKYEEIYKKCDEFASQNIQLMTQAKQDKDVINELQIENKSLKEGIERSDLIIEQGNINNDIEKESIVNKTDNIIKDEKTEMVNKAREFFEDKGIKINSSGYSEMVGTNLYTEITELEGHRVFAFTIDNYDIKDNNVWFYYSPETEVGYRYENETWTKL